MSPSNSRATTGGRDDTNAHKTSVRVSNETMAIQYAQQKVGNSAENKNIQNKKRFVADTRRNNRNTGYVRGEDSESSASDYSESSSSSSDYSGSSDRSHSTDRSSNAGGKYKHSYKKPAMPSHSQYIAMDCEMVTTTTESSACARVVMIDWKGRTVLDMYVKPTDPILDYKTFVSGITAEDLEGAEPLEAVREEVLDLLDGKILVGHGLQNDLECLGVAHPWYMIRDTAYYEPFMKPYYGTLSPRKLKELAKEKLQKDIQVIGQAHSPTEDAMSALELYKCHRPRWEACMLSKIKESQRLVRQQLRQQQREQEMMMSGHQQNYYYQHEVTN